MTQSVHNLTINAVCNLSASSSAIKAESVTLEFTYLSVSVYTHTWRHKLGGNYLLLTPDGTAGAIYISGDKTIGKSVLARAC